MGPDSTVRPADVLAAFERQERGTPLTAPEVADAVGCARRTAHEKLTVLTDRGSLETKKVGARARVWWQPATRRADAIDPGDVDRPPGDSERALRELHSASRRLMQAETREAVCAIAVDAAKRVLGLTLSGLWLYDPDREVLEPVEWTESGVEEYGEPAAFPIDDSLVGQVFTDGTYRVYDDVTTEGEVYDPETDVRSELVLPLGGHGVLNASSPAVGAFDAVDVSLGRILAANVETALDRADQLARRRERRRELERQRDELATLNRINALIEDTIGSLVDAATREEIEGAVCDRLADSTLYADAWIVTRESSGGGVVRTGTGASRVEPDVPFPPEGPVARAMAECAPQVVPRIAESEGFTDRLLTVGGAADAAACLAVPLRYADTVFGALVVYAPEPDAFSDRERTAFETLGRVVGFVINATNNRRLLLGNTAVELEVGLRGTNAWFLAAADRFGGTVTVEGLVPNDDGTVVEYVTVEGTDDTAPADLADMAAVVDVRVLAADDDRWLCECTVRGEDAALGTIAEYGATVRTARAADGGGTVTARFPATASPRESMAVVSEAFPTADLVAKRVVDVSDRSVLTIRQAVEDRLTEKQLSVLRAAFLAGYYESPRGTTAQELADSLNIAASTLYGHLQAAQRKLLATVFDELSADERRKASA